MKELVYMCFACMCRTSKLIKMYIVRRDTQRKTKGFGRSPLSSAPTRVGALAELRRLYAEGRRIKLMTF